MNIKMLDNLYELLDTNKDLIEHKPIIVKDAAALKDKFPRVLLVEVTNTETKLTTRFEESRQDFYYTVYIYAKDLYEDNNIVPKIDVARQIARDIDTIFKSIKLERVGSVQPVPNLDGDIYELGMRYRTALNNRNLFI